MIFVLNFDVGLVLTYSAVGGVHRNSLLSAVLRTRVGGWRATRSRAEAETLILNDQYNECTDLRVQL
jgi:hypothetical protein